MYTLSGQGGELYTLVDKEGGCTPCDPGGQGGQLYTVVNKGYNCTP